MKETEPPTHIDELLLNVLGGEYFKARNISAKLIPVVPKSIAQKEAKIL